VCIEVVGISSLDKNAEAVPRLKIYRVVQINLPVDFRRIPMRARNGAVLAYCIDQHLNGLPHPGRQQFGTDGLLVLHQAVVTLLLDLFREVTGQRVRGGAADIFIFEAAHARELRLFKPIEKELEVLLGLPGKARP
jgi:hypothetical protein